MIIRTENLCHIYGQNTPFCKVAIENVNICVDKGEFIGLIGHTGSGKSTLAQHFNGLIRPTSGKVYIDGTDIWENPREIRNLRFKVGLVFQYPEHQLFEETVFADIAFGPKNMGLSPSQIEDRVIMAMDFVGLKPQIAQKSPFELSGGQRRRVAIAGVMAMQPDILILDEPTAGLDPRGRDKILGRIKQYHIASKSTVILVSHSMEDIAKTVDRIIVMNNGTNALSGTPRDIFGDSERILGMGLDIPQITKVLKSLKARGLDIDDAVYTVEGAKQEILRLLSKRRGGESNA